jgi:hypothetical protein
MSVVYLPEDKRWTMVGEGLGSLVGAFVSRKLNDSNNQRVMKGIHDIEADDSIIPQDKPYLIGQRYGDHGLAMRQAILKQAQSGIATAHTQAETDLARSRNVQVQQQTQTQAQMAPLQQQELQGKVAAQPLQRENLAGEITARGMKTPLEAHNLELTGQKTAQELQDEQGRRDALARTLATNKPPEGMDPAQWYAIQLEGALGGPKAAASGIAATTKAQTAAEEVGPRETARIAAQDKAKAGTKPLENVDRQQVANAASLTEDMGTVLKSIENDPKAQGGISGYFKQLLTSHGYGTDPAFTALVAAAHQQVQTSATSGSGFTGKTRVDLAKDVSPTVIKDKIQQIMDVNQYIHNQTARMESIRAEYAKDPQRNLEAIDSSIAGLKKITDTTDTLWYTKDGKAIFYKGQQINPKTFEPVKGGSKELSGEQSVDVGNGNTAKGQQLNDFARMFGVTPEQAVAVTKALQGPEHGTLKQTVEKVTGVKRPDLEGR